MTELHNLTWPMLCGLALSWLPEQAMQPKLLPLQQRGLASILLHCGIWLVLFTLLLLLCQRPWLVIAIIFAFQGLLVMVHQAKFSTLQEAFIFQDFEYFTDAIQHPKLYLPFFGITRTVIATLAFITAIALGIGLEKALSDTLGLAFFLLVCTALLSIGGLCITIAHQHSPKILYKPNEDLQQLGQSAFFWHYWFAEKYDRHDFSQNRFSQLPTVPSTPDKLSDIIVVQSESFFDPRCFYAGIKANVLENFDQLQAESCQHGRLQVPAWGANTVRTECAFLTGLTGQQLGIHQFNPYRLLAKQSIPNLAGSLKQLGYQTVCIHPYPISFYQRDLVYPRLGFDHFIDIKAFNATQMDGQYTSDSALATKVIELLDNTRQQPIFIFVITMENHGPLHLEKPASDDLEKLHHQPPPRHCEDLTVYLRHLKNADLMVKRLTEKLRQRQQEQDKESILCWYGDHVPIMTNVYGQLGAPDGCTDYALWNSRTAAQQNPAKPPQPLSIDKLAMRLLKAAGLTC